MGANRSGPPDGWSSLGLGPTVTPHAEAGANAGFVLSVSQLKTTRTCTALPGQWSRKHRLSSCSPENRRPSDPHNTSRASSPAAGRSGAVARDLRDAARARRVRGAVAKAASLRQRNRKLCNRTAVHVPKPAAEPAGGPHVSRPDRGDSARTAKRSEPHSLAIDSIRLDSQRLRCPRGRAAAMLSHHVPSPQDQRALAWSAPVGSPVSDRRPSRKHWSPVWLGSGGESVTRRPRLESDLSGLTNALGHVCDTLAVYCVVQQSECRLRMVQFFLFTQSTKLREPTPQGRRFFRH